MPIMGVEGFKQELSPAQTAKLINDLTEAIGLGAAYKKRHEPFDPAINKEKSRICRRRATLL